MHKELNIKNPMASNWECGVLTKEAMIECKKNMHICNKYYPNFDAMSMYPGFMALKTEQKWKFPSVFLTWDPTCYERNHIVTLEQLKQKKSEGYYSIKRVNYSKNCNIKDFIRKNYYVS